VFDFSEFVKANSWRMKLEAAGFRVIEEPHG
jgi:hypothetical protein